MLQKMITGSSSGGESIFHYKLAATKSEHGIINWSKSDNPDNNFSKLKLEAKTDKVSSITYQPRPIGGSWGTATNWTVGTEIDLSNLEAVEIVVISTSAGTGYAKIAIYS